MHTYENFEEMLADPGVDMVSICLPSGMHAEFAIRAVAAGKHVLIEKPIDITEEAARRIIEARDKYDVRVGVVHQNRYNACMAPIKKQLIQGVSDASSSELLLSSGSVNKVIMKTAGTEAGTWTAAVRL